MEQFNIILNQEIVFFITIVVGFCAVKLGLLSESSLPAISKVFSNILLPFLIFINVLEGTTREDLFSSFFVLVIQIVIYAIVILFNRLIIRLARLKGNKSRIYLMCASMGNMGFVGIPLILSVYGQHAMVYISLFTLVDQALLWSYGVSLSYPEGSEGARFRIELKTLKKLINPPMIATVCVLLAVIIKLRLPYTVATAMRNLSTASTPLPFLYLGGVLATCSIKQMLKEWSVYIIVLTKMIALPILVFLCLRLFNLSSELIGVFVIFVGLPCIAIAPMLARENGSDEVLATAATTISTVASLVSFPLVFFLTSLI